MKLVAKLNDAWGVFDVDGHLIILPLRKPRCGFVWDDAPCYGELLLHDFMCYYHPMIDHYHCDVRLKCVRCGKVYIFGLAVPQELFRQLQRSRFHGKALRREIIEVYGDETPREVVERLKKWGYW